MSESSHPWKEYVSTQAILLGVFSLVATALLVMGNLATRDAIAERLREDLRASLSQVIPDSAHDNDLLAHALAFKDDNSAQLMVYRGTRDGKLTALAWEITGKGYAGNIRLVLGVDTNGKILGVRVLQHAETPGLGDNIEASRSDWILGFNGLSLGNPPAEKWKVRKDGGQFDSFSGATITPRGVVTAIRQGLEFFRSHKTTLTQPVEITSPEKIS